VTAKAEELDAKPAHTTGALPLGGRIKVDPWSDQLQMAKARATGTLSEAERMSFQITPFYFYLTRAENSSPTQIPVGVAAKLDREANTK